MQKSVIDHMENRYFRLILLDEFLSQLDSQDNQNQESMDVSCPNLNENRTIPLVSTTNDPLVSTTNDPFVSTTNELIGQTEDELNSIDHSLKIASMDITVGGKCVDSTCDMSVDKVDKETGVIASVTMRSNHGLSESKEDLQMEVNVINPTNHTIPSGKQLTTTQQSNDGSSTACSETNDSPANPLGELQLQETIIKQINKPMLTGKRPPTTQHSSDSSSSASNGSTTSSRNDSNNPPSTEQDAKSDNQETHSSDTKDRSEESSNESNNHTTTQSSVIENDLESQSDNSNSLEEEHSTNKKMEIKKNVKTTVHHRRLLPTKKNRSSSAPGRITRSKTVSNLRKESGMHVSQMVVVDSNELISNEYFDHQKEA
jgi:hypothetical protein